MLSQKVIDIIEAAYPAGNALEWDNVGLLAGRNDKEVKNIYVALDATDEVVDAAVSCGADMLVTHHPLIFGGMKRICNTDYIGKRIIKLIQNDITYFAMHTNYDVLGMAELSGNKLGFKNAEVLEAVSEEDPFLGIGRVADMEYPATLSDCCNWVKESFQTGPVKVFGDLSRTITRAAISPGSGKRMIGAALIKKAEVLITGDIDHHTGIDAVAQGLAVIDAGHYGIEHIFVEDVGQFLEREIPGANVITAPDMHPFTIV